MCSMVSRIEIRPKPPYLISHHLRVFSLPGKPVPHIFEGSTLTRLLCLRKCFPIRVEFKGEPWDPVLSVEVYGSGSVGGVLDVVRKMLRVDFNYSEFLDAVREYPEIRSLALRYAGLRPGRCVSLYYALIDSIVKQAVSLKQALNTMAKIIVKYGRGKRVGEAVFYEYPSPARLLKADVGKLRSLGLSRTKAKAIVEVARAENEGRLPSEKEAEKDPDGVIKELTKIYGVGVWTAQLSIAMVSKEFTLGPANDLSVRRGLERLFRGEVPYGRIVEIIRNLRNYMGLIMYLASYEYEILK